MTALHIVGLLFLLYALILVQAARRSIWRYHSARNGLQWASVLILSAIVLEVLVQ